METTSEQNKQKVQNKRDFPITRADKVDTNFLLPVQEWHHCIFIMTSFEEIATA